MATAKRRLPMLKSEGDGHERDEARPAWQWVGFGTVMIFIAWLPLAYVGTAIVVRPGGGGAETRPGGAHLGGVLLATLLPLALAALAGGFLVGRFGKPAGVREALVAGAATGLLAVGLTALSGPFSPLFLLVIALATGFAGVGGVVGVRRRRGSEIG
jgi:hypothetical protein